MELTKDQPLWSAFVLARGRMYWDGWDWTLDPLKADIFNTRADAEQYRKPHTEIVFLGLSKTKSFYTPFVERSK